MMRFKCKECQSIMEASALVVREISNPKPSRAPVTIRQCPECGAVELFTLITDGITPMDDRGFVVDQSAIFRGYSRVFQFSEVKTGRHWRVAFRVHPNFGIEASGDTPTVEELVTVLANTDAPVCMIPIIQAAHATGKLLELASLAVEKAREVNAAGLKAGE